MPCNDVSLFDGLVITQELYESLYQTVPFCMSIPHSSFTDALCAEGFTLRGRLGQCCQSLTLQAAVETCFDDEYHSTPISSTVALMSDSSTSVPPLEGLRHVWFDGFAVSVGLPLSLRVSLQLITSVSAFHPSLL